MKKAVTYVVAGHRFDALIPEKLANSRLLSSYEPFRVEDADRLEEEPVFTLEIEVGELPPAGELMQLCNDESPFLWIYEDLSFGFSFTRERPSALLRFEKKDGENVWSKACVHIIREQSFAEADSAISNAMMLLYAYNTGWKDTLMLHASAPMVDGRGYVFLGKSGTGKSTHSRMWLENIEGTELLNDDNPVVRVIGDEVIVYGTPWSGKTPCYKNMSVPLGGVVRIVRAPHNKAVRLSALESFASLMPACSCMKWDEKWVDAQQDTIEKVISKVPGWNMECLPDADAAKVCFGAVASL